MKDINRKIMKQLMKRIMYVHLLTKSEIYFKYNLYNSSECDYNEYHSISQVDILHVSQ